MEKRDTGIDKLMWKNARHLESILPEHVDVKAFVGTAWAALLANDTLMQNAVNKPDTLLVALFRCAAKGHQPGTEEYYLTPRDGGVLGIEGYRGIVERMYRSGAVAKVVVREVCAKDYFRFIEGEDDKPVHDFGARRGGTTGADFFGQDGDPDRGAMVGVYAVAKLMTGDWSRPVLLSRNDVFAYRAAGGWKPTDKYSPWNRLDAGPEHPELTGRSMWLKSAARRLEPWVPTSAEYRREQIRAAASAAAASGQGIPLLGSVESPDAEITDAEIIEPTAIAPNGNEPAAGEDSTEPGSAPAQQVGQIASMFQDKFEFKQTEGRQVVTISEQIAGRELTGPNDGHALSNLSGAEARKLLSTLDPIKDRGLLIEHLAGMGASDG
jgi:recombination protein RecT